MVEQLLIELINTHCIVPGNVVSLGATPSASYIAEITSAFSTANITIGIFGPSYIQVLTDWKTSTFNNKKWIMSDAAKNDT